MKKPLQSGFFYWYPSSDSYRTPLRAPFRSGYLRLKFKAQPVAQGIGKRGDAFGLPRIVEQIESRFKIKVVADHKFQCRIAGNPVVGRFLYVGLKKGGIGKIHFFEIVAKRKVGAEPVIPAFYGVVVLALVFAHVQHTYIKPEVLLFY